MYINKYLNKPLNTCKPSCLCVRQVKMRSNTKGVLPAEKMALFNCPFSRHDTPKEMGF